LKIDSLIVGQGLAGSLLALHLLERGQRILVVDRDEANTSSKVAAGLVTPLAGARFNLPAGLETRLDYARAFYWNHEEAGGMTFFHHRRIARLFQSAAERTAWNARLEKERERYARFHEPLAIDTRHFPGSFGGFEMKEGGWLDVPAFSRILAPAAPRARRLRHWTGKIRGRHARERRHPMEKHLGLPD